jgi:hypothetical protein
VADGDELDRLAQRSLELLEVDLAVLVVADDDDLGAGRARQLQVGHVVARVLGARGDDAVAGREADRVEDGVPGARAVLEQGDLVGVVGVYEPRGRGVDVREAGLGGLLGLVAADAALELEVRDDRVDDGSRHERRARVVEVHALLAAGRVAAQRVDVDRWRSHGRPD